MRYLGSRAIRGKLGPNGPNVFNTTTHGSCVQNGKYRAARARSASKARTHRAERRENASFIAEGRADDYDRRERVQWDVDYLCGDPGCDECHWQLARMRGPEVLPCIPGAAVIVGHVEEVVNQAALVVYEVADVLYEESVIFGARLDAASRSVHGW